MATPLRYYSPRFLRLTAGLLYGPGAAETNARRAHPPSIWGYASQLIAAAGWSSLPRLHRIKSPTLVLAGGADRMVPPINARILAARIPGAERLIIPAAGHLMLIDHAELLATRIADFLDS
jgi:pimeloyl-ACP methyl ester carboxylesterase